MPNTPNYNEATILGQSWQRACRVVIENPYAAAPSIVFVEEKVYNLEDKVIREPVSNLNVQFDQENLLHVEIYTKLNDLYTQLREIRDTPVAPQVEPPVETPTP